MFRTRLLIIVVTILFGVNTAPQQVAGAQDSRDRDFVAQIASVAAMGNIVVVLNLYAADHGGHFPDNLQSLVGSYKFPDWSLRDGWKRPLYYYSTGTSYILISYGRSGQPDSQTSTAGGVSGEKEYEADIVLINGAWAQSPTGVDRELS